jgi:hypothetical protein
LDVLSVAVLWSPYKKRGTQTRDSQTWDKLTIFYIRAEQLEVVQKIVKSNVSEVVKESIVKRLSGGRCCICGAIATQMVTYDASGEKEAEKRIAEEEEKALASNTLDDIVDQNTKNKIF